MAIVKDRPDKRPSGMVYTVLRLIIFPYSIYFTQQLEFWAVAGLVITEHLELSPVLISSVQAKTLRRKFEDYTWPGTVREWELGAVLMREGLTRSQGAGTRSGSNGAKNLAQAKPFAQAGD